MAEGELQEGTLLNERYRIIRTIGHGGMGTVYQAEHERLNAILAVKEIRGQPSTGTAQQATLQQYEQEARFLVRLNHPNLPKVTDAFTENDRFYLVMEFIEGVTLEVRCREAGGKPLDVALVLGWGLQIADVLAYLHSQQPAIIFRDLKPSNVMVQPDGGIRLIDFGIARRFQPGADKDTALLGSVGYSPPEQFGRHQTDTRSDIYAFGATLHHLLTGRDPSATPFKFPPANQLNPAVPESLATLLAHCLAMDAEQRPANIHVVASALLAIRDQVEEARLRAEAAPPPEANRPRIISAKLQEAGKSRPLRPDPSRTPAGSASGKTNVPPRSDQSMRIVVLAVCLVILLASGALGLFSYAHSRNMRANSHPPPNPTNTVMVTPPVVIPADPTPKPVDPTPPNGGTVNQGANPPPVAPPAPDANAAAVCKADVQGITADGKSVRVHVIGEIKGKKSTAGMVAVYFYNADGSSLPAHNADGSYASKSGQLYGTYTFQIDADQEPFEGTMDIPIAEFPTMADVKYRGVVYADNQSAGQTEMTALPVNLPPISTSGAARGHRRSGGIRLDTGHN